MPLRSLLNVTYEALTAGKEDFEVAKIDAALDGTLVAEPKSTSRPRTDPAAMRALMAAASMPQVGGPPRRPPHLRNHPEGAPE